jgi:hypothetical protein
MGNLKEFKIIDLIDNETNKVKYSNYIDLNTDHTSEEFEEIYIGEMMELFNIDSNEMNTLHYDIHTKMMFTE